MKKILILWMFITLNTIMANDTYVGVDLSMASNTHTYTGSGTNLTPYEVDNDTTGLKFKLGYGENGDWKIQGYFAVIAFDKGVYDSENNPLYEVGAEVIKEFTLSEDIYPFVKGGFGFGMMGVSGYGQASASEMTYSLGAGLLYQAFDSIALVGGLDYLHREWGNITEAVTLQHKNVQDEAMAWYVGVNYTF